MGTTTLVLEWIKDRDDAVYDQARRGSAEQQRSSGASDAAAVSPDIPRMREAWAARFEYLANVGADESSSYPTRSLGVNNERSSRTAAVLRSPSENPERQKQQ